MKKIALTVIFTSLLTVVSLAQTAAPVPAPTPPTDDEVVKISTTLIQVDVTVTDAKGNIVTDLKPEEVEIYENGKKQDISGFSFISNIGAQTPAPVAEKGKPAIPAPPATARPEQVRRTIALVVDDLTLSFQSTYQVRRALKNFVDEQMQPGDLVAIIRTGAGVGALQQFTTDKRQLYAAIEKVRWNPAGAGKIGSFTPLEGQPPAGTEIERQQQERRQEQETEFNDFRSSVFATGTLGAVNYIISGMQDLPGRKSVMLMSDGFALFTRNADDFVDSSRVLDSLRRLIDAANRASVVVYTMDARGLVVTGLTASDDTSGRTNEQIEQSLSNRSRELFDTQEGLMYLARQTGGTAIINNNDLSGGIRQMLKDQSYYLIGFQPEGDTFDPKTRRFNKIEIKIKRPRTRVRYRSGFFGVSDDQLAARPKGNMTPAQQIQNALISPFAANDVSLRLNALFGGEVGTGSYVRSFLHIQARDFDFTDEPGGGKKAVFDVLAAAFGDNGAVVDEISKTYTLTINKEVYERFLNEGFVYDFSFPMKKSGAYQLRVAVRDRASGKVGSANQFIEVPNLKKSRLTLQGIVLQNMNIADWQKISAGQPLSDDRKNELNPLADTALRRFKRGTVLNYGTKILNAKLDAAQKSSLTMQTRIFRDGKLFFEGKPLPVSADGQPSQSSVGISSAITLGTEMSPGEYVLQLVITDNLAKENRRVATQFVQFELL